MPVVAERSGAAHTGADYRVPFVAVSYASSNAGI
jgi:hypothetical protein